MIKDLCPDCGCKLHEGQSKFKDGLYKVKYCKECGFRYEVPEEKLD